MSPRARAVLVGLCLWTAPAAAAWALFRVLGGPEARGLFRWGLWGASVALMVGGGLLLMRAGRRFFRPDPTAESGLAAGLAWGIASAAGWFFDVSVGGPFSGMALGFIDDRSQRDRRPWARIALVLGVGLVGLAVGIRFLGGRGSMLALVSALVVGLPVLLLANRWLGVGTAAKPLVWATLAWGVAWVGSWALTSSALAQRLLGTGSLPAEVVLACALGAMLYAAGRNAALWPIVSDGATWAAAGLAAVLAGTLIHRALLALGTDPGPGGTWLDLGYTIGLTLFIPLAWDRSNRGPAAGA